MKRGFTLLEIIVTLMLFSVIGLITTLSIVPMTEALFQTRTNVHAAQKTHLAAVRLTREFTTITNISASGSTFIQYDFLDPQGVGRSRTLEWSGEINAPLMLNNIPLSDDIALFELRYLAEDGVTAFTQWGPLLRFIEIRIRPRTVDTTYSARVLPRNLRSGP